MFSESGEYSESLFSFESSIAPVGVDRSFGSGVCWGWIGPFPPTTLMLSELSSFSVVVLTLSNLLSQFCEESPGLLPVPLRWRKSVPHFSRGGCRLEAQTAAPDRYFSNAPFQTCGYLGKDLPSPGCGKCSSLPTTADWGLFIHGFTTASGKSSL